MTVLEVPTSKKPTEVEVITLSKKSSEKKGKAKIHMWEPSKKKPCTIMVCRHSGSQFVFLKTVMEKFLKPFMDSLIIEPKESLLSQYSKHEGNDKKSFKVEKDLTDPELTEKCEKCGQMCKGKRGLGIHVGRMHRNINEEDTKKRKFGDDKKTVNFETQKDDCDVCGLICSSKTDLNQHKAQCIAQRDEFYKAQNETKIIQTKFQNICEKVSKLCSECDIKIEAHNAKELILKTIQHNNICTMKLVSNEAIRTSEPTPSPPHKKMKDTENAEVECELEKILNSMKQMEVDEKIEGSMTEEIIPEHIDEIKEEEMLPKRLQNMLGFKGIDITEHKLCRVSGGGKCGYNCISLHTTGSEEMSSEIARNKNEHIVSNWEDIYKQCYEFPYTERVGGTSRTFETEEDFLIFLLTDKEASAMWMTHESMQAVSTMMNMNISILTTGVAPSVLNSCPRCSLQTIFKTNEELRIHTEIVHHRKESVEEKEGERRKDSRSQMDSPEARLQNQDGYSK